MAVMFQHQVQVEGVKFAFQRRRYGKRTFTWVYVWDGNDWQGCGDPWPSVTVPRRDLEQLAAKVMAGQLPIISDSRNRL